MTVRKLGLIAGGGGLPAEIAERCRAAGRPYFVIRLRGFADDGTADHPSEEIGLAELGKCFKKPRSNTDPFPQSYARATSVDATSATTFEQPSTETSAIGSDYGTNSNDLNVDQAFDWRGANSMMDLDMDLIMGMAGVVDSKVAVV